MIVRCNAGALLHCARALEYGYRQVDVVVRVCGRVRSRDSALATSCTCRPTARWRRRAPRRSGASCSKARCLPTASTPTPTRTSLRCVARRPPPTPRHADAQCVRDTHSRARLTGRARGGGGSGGGSSGRRQGGERRDALASVELVARAAAARDRGGCRATLDSDADERRHDDIDDIDDDSGGSHDVERADDRRDVAARVAGRRRRARFARQTQRGVGGARARVCVCVCVYVCARRRFHCIATFRRRWRRASRCR